MADSINPSGVNKNLAINLLPNFYKTDPNKRFLQATVDQLVKPGTVKKVNGYIGRQNAKAVTGEDIFVKAVDASRQNYQLEPGLVIDDALGNNTFFKDYIDYINQLQVFGANVDNHARLNKQEYYSWNPHIDWDKFVNFQNYYWLSYGPETIKIFGQQLDAISTYKVTLTSDLTNNHYVFTPDGLTPNPAIKLYRGQTYKFEINSPGNPFSIKIARTTEALDKYQDGVTNNSIETGTLTFRVPVDAPSILYYQSEADVNSGGVFEVFSVDENSYIDVEADILGKSTYTLSDGTELSNGMKVAFGGQVTPALYASGEYYVEGVGTAIQLIDKTVLEVASTYSSSETLKFDSQPFDTDAFGDLTGYAKKLDYIVVNRLSKDHNPWSRYNRWFHKDVIESSAKYNGAVANLDQSLRAVRPIIEFEANLKLFNFGTTATADIDLVDTFTTDAFSVVEGSLGYNVDGISLSQGQKILFLADTDRLVKNNLYQVEFIDVQHTVTAGTTTRQIRLVKIAEPQVNDVVLVKAGKESQGLMYWYNGTTWIKAQQKTDVNQTPMFDVVDANGISFGDLTVYDGSTFAGTTLFSYKVSSATPDTNLGFALSYKNINNIGDIVFKFSLLSDTFQYKEIVNVITKKIETGYLVKTDYAGNTVYTNGWEIGTATNVQAAVRIYKNSNLVNDFDLDIFDDVDNLADLKVKVYVNGIRLSPGSWSVVDAVGYKKIHLATDIALTDVLTVKAYTSQPCNRNGHYEIPINLQNNPLNEDLLELTLGEVIDHVGSIVENLEGFTGSYPGASNIRDLGDITPYGTKFVQHSGPASLSLYHITSNTNNIVRAIEQSRDAYNQFKKNFISVAESLGVDASPVEQVNLILQSINKDKPTSFPYYFSDMVPYRASTTSKITVVDSRITAYPLTDVFNLDSLTNRAVGVYVNDTQLLYKREYTFNSDGFVIITAPLVKGDTVSIYEYSSTDGSFVPETPTKLGMWPKFEPKIYTDTTLITPRLMIQGHDGSQTLAYGDYRDEIILELEKRIYNNIKVDYDTSIFDLTTIVPSYSRTTDYSLSEFNQVLAPNFYKWTGLINKDFTKQIGYDQYNSFTYNYTGHITLDGRNVPGYWRGIYNWILDTDRPHICPWEMLGFSIEPTWWQELYGPSPYTSDNRVMWQDIADGIIREPGKPFTRVEKYAKPFLMKHLPVDALGNLVSPSKSGLSKGVVTTATQDDFIFGDAGPVETAWRRSSHYPYSVILTSLLLAPSHTFGVLLDRSKVVRNLTGQLIYKDTGLRIKPLDVVLPSIYSSDTRIQTSGIVNYISNYILSDNMKSYDDYKYDLANINAKVSYRLGAFTAKEKFNLLLDSKTPLSTGNVFIPPENYNIVLNVSSPVKKITYSGVVITKLQDAYEVKGYSKTQPYFKYYPYQRSGTTINVGGISESFVAWTSNQTYIVGKVVKYNEKYYRVTTSHVSANLFNPANFVALSRLPIIGGRDAIIRTKWDRESPITVSYGYKFYEIQDVVDFLIGYGEFLKDEGFIFDEFNTNLNAVTNWETSAKEFLFWTTQNWSAGQDKWNEWSSLDLIDFGSIVRYNGDYFKAIRNIEAGTEFNQDDYVKLDGLSSVGSSVISLSPSADKITFTTDLCVVDDIKNPFNGYEIFRVDGAPLEAMFINSYREDNAVSYSPRTSDGIYGASFYLIQHEHVAILDNSTMFNDTIYSPTTGYKQDRIKVAGYVSTDWYGGLDIPGFILDVANIQNWTAWTDYDLGDIVKYKQFYYTASKFLPGAEKFDAAVWIRLDKKPTTQMLPNWSYKASQFEDFYSLDSDNFDSAQQKMAQHLVGYQKRQYLENIIQDDVSEFKFYQGMIAEKGTQNVLNKLFDVLSADNQESLDFYEEWALRVGQYGASQAFENIEFILDESQFRNNPQGFELTNTSEVTANFIIRQSPTDIYLKPLGYNNAPWPKLESYQKFLRSAGYVRQSETFLNLKSLDDIVGQDITTFDNGCYISVAFKGTDWDVYRYSSTTIKVTSVTYSDVSKTLTLELEELSKLKVGNYIGLLGVSLLNGFYKVINSTLNIVTLSATFKTFPVPFTQSEDVRVYTLNSQRIASIDDLDQVATASLLPNEQIWTDKLLDGRWATWTYNPVYNSTTIPNSSPTDGLNYGRFIATNTAGNILAVSTGAGEIETWDKASYKSSWIQRQTIQKPYVEPNVLNLSKNLATVVAISADGQWLATGSPLASHAYTRYVGDFSLIDAYEAGDIVGTSDGFYEALFATSGDVITVDGNVLPDPMFWKHITYIPIDLAGTGSGLEEQGIISLYQKDSNNIFSIVSSIVSPNPAAGEHFGSNLVFGNDTLYITASGYNNVGRVYKMSFATTTYKSTPYNPVGSTGTLIVVTSTEGILPGMTVVGTGFTSSHTVEEIVSSTKLRVSKAPTVTPSGVIQFTLTNWGYDFSETYIGVDAQGNFGNSLAISADNSTLVISASGGQVNGKVFIIHTPGLTSTQVVLSGTSPAYGQSITISADSSYLAISDSLASEEKLYQGSVTVYKHDATAGTYIESQRLVNHLPEESGYFGSKIAFMNDYKTLVVYSAYEDTTTYTTLDENTTVFDSESTKFLTKHVDSGRVDVYDMYASKWVYSETLAVPTVQGEGYGVGFAVGGDHIIVGAPYAMDQTLVSGKVFDYLKAPNTLSWTIKHEEVNKPDVSKVKKAFLYNRKTGELVKYLDVIDVAQGKIPGPAAEELRYNTFYDPAVYSVGTSAVKVDANAPWTKEPVGRLWWDLRTSKFLDGYDSEVVYRTSVWNTLATGASVDIYEWVETTLLPDAWDKIADTEQGLSAGISGTSLYGNAVYSVRQRYDSVAQSFKNTYYFWVKNKKTVPNVAGRYLSAQSVANLIANPRGHGYTYLSLTGLNSFSLVNAKQYLKDAEVVLSVEYWTIDKTDQNIHSEWKIINNDIGTVIPAPIELKWVDSLCGKDLAGRSLPDFEQPLKLRYGVENKPRQSMFVNRFEALKQLVEKANIALAENQIVQTSDISALLTYDTPPSTITGLYDYTENTEAELRFVSIGAFKRPTFGAPIIVDGRITGVTITYPGRGYLIAPYLTITGSGIGAVVRATINQAGQVTGATVLFGGEGYDDNTTVTCRDYSVLVYSDTQAQNNWSIYSYDPSEHVWSRVKSQTYDVRKYWSYIDWFATGYNQFTAIDYVVDTIADLNTITVEIGQTVKVKTGNANSWTLLEKYSDVQSLDYTQSYNVVGIGNGTIKLSSSLYEALGTNTGYDSSTYDDTVFDNAPALELRIILESLKNSIFINDLKVKYLDLFFTTLRYALSEQVYIDWAFKSSFVKARHNVGTLHQPATYRSDNLANYQDYIAEVKPYRTKIREYVSSYQTLDTGSMLVSDFDLPPVYRDNRVTTINTNVTNGTVQAFSANVNEYPWKAWYDNVGYQVIELKIINGGAGYINEPVVKITSDSGAGAKARAFYTNGVVNRIVLLAPGNGYLSAPTVTLDGGINTGGTPAKVVAIIGDGLVRTNKIKVKFDRTTYTNYVNNLEETEVFSPYVGSNTIPTRLQFPLTWAPDIKINQATVTVKGVLALRDSYKLSVVSSTVKGYTSYTGLITFTEVPKGEVSVTYNKDISLLNAADRIKYFYNPAEGELGNDFAQLMSGVDYGGVIVSGMGFEVSAGWGALPYFTDKWDSFDANYDDYLVTVQANTHTFTLPYVPADGVELNVYHGIKNVDSHISDGVTLKYSYNVYDNNPSFEVIRTVEAGAVASNYQPTGSTGTTLKVIDTTGILPGMYVVGTGFASMQKVVTVVNSTTLTISSAPNTLPNGTLNFTKSVAGSTTLSLVSTEGLKVGDKIASDDISAFGYESSIKQIVNDTEIILNQILYETVIPGMSIVFSRPLVIPTDLTILTSGTITLKTPITAGSVINIYGSLDPVRIDDPEFGTIDQTNPYAVMTTIVGDGVTDTFSIPSNYTINDNDLIIIRKSTSDGAITPPESDYDTALTGGDMGYSSATGLAADDILLDGDGFVTPTSSPAPEEVVPGQIVDTLAIKVFDQPANGSANIKVDNYIADGVANEFDITQDLSSSTSVIVKITSGVAAGTTNSSIIKTLNEDYVVDFDNKKIIFDVAPDANDIVSIFSLGFAGANILDIDYFVGDGSTIEFITRSLWLDSITSLVYLDGVVTNPDLFRTDATYDSANRIAMRFGVAPPAGSIVHFIIVSGENQSFSVTKTERILTNGALTYPLEYKVGDFLPYESNMIVRVDNTILSSPVNAYFEIKNNKLNYTVDPTKVLPYSTPISDVSVFVEDVKLSLGSDYTIDPGGLTIKINKLVYALYAKKTLVVSIDTNQSYSYNALTGEITFTTAYDNSNIVEVITSYKHDYLDIQKTETTISSNLSITADTLAYYDYKGLTNGTIKLDRPVLDSSYVWVVQNNILLTPSIDFILKEDKQTVQLAVEPELGDKFQLTTFGTNVLGAGVSYMQFKDMLNRVHYKRLSLNKRTRLAQDLKFNDTVMIVEDASNFDVPNPSIRKPGIVEIHGERIEFYEINGNTLGKLRRGTLGTGTPAIHMAGRYVQELGPSETIPYVDNFEIEQVISDSSNIIPLSYAPAKSVELAFNLTVGRTYVIETLGTTNWNTVAGTTNVTYVKGSTLTVAKAGTGTGTAISTAYGQSNEIEVFVGGYNDATSWVASGVSYKVGDIVTIGSYTYRCVTAHTSSATFKKDIANWTLFVGNLRLKKIPYSVHSELKAPYSPEGDIRLDAEFAVDGTSKHIKLANTLSFGTRVTVVKRVGTDWDSTTNIQVSDSKVAKFLKATPGIWYSENRVSGN